MARRFTRPLTPPPMDRNPLPRETCNHVPLWLAYAVFASIHAVVLLLALALMAGAHAVGVCGRVSDALLGALLRRADAKALVRGV